MRTPPAARVGPPSRVRVPFVPPLACEYLVAFFRVRVPFSTFSRVRVAYSSPRAQNDVDAAVGVDNARNLSHTKRPRSVFEGLSRQQGKTKVSRRKKKSTKRRQAGRQTGRQTTGTIDTASKAIKAPKHIFLHRPVAEVCARTFEGRNRRVAYE